MSDLEGAFTMACYTAIIFLVGIALGCGLRPERPAIRFWLGGPRAAWPVSWGRYDPGAFDWNERHALANLEWFGQIVVRCHGGQTVIVRLKNKVAG